ncbi:uncharacterized protein LOC129317603 [Prosopis cineraria]|uniref:uncharacterized protein LOC129317603 n=1 Tax=Prosopis cineraria TaxID=364024 RepID=UPI00240EBD90|nr:uncharacterized protein LOC129317603 [Prosopis cineraria]
MVSNISGSRRSSPMEERFEGLSWDQLMACVVDDSLTGEEDLRPLEFCGEVNSLSRKILRAPRPIGSSFTSSNFAEAVRVKKAHSFDLNEEAVEDGEDVSDGDAVLEFTKASEKKNIVYPFDLNKFPFPEEDYAHLTEEEKDRDEDVKEENPS